MIRKLPVAASLAAAIILSVAGASAQGVSQRAYTKADLSGWTGDPGTLTRMIQQIEAKTGGRVIEIRYSSSDSLPGFRVAVAKEGGVTFYSVAAENADTIEMSAASVPDWMLKWKARADVRQALRATVPLSDAISTAEKASDGAPAVAAGIASSASNPTSDVQAYNVLIWRSGEVHRVAVDDKSGQVIADPRALADWP